MNTILGIAVMAAPFVAVVTACILIWAMRLRDNALQISSRGNGSVFDETGIVEKLLHPSVGLNPEGLGQNC